MIYLHCFVGVNKLKINVIEEIRRVFGDKCLEDIEGYLENVLIKKPKKEGIEKCLLLKKFSRILLGYQFYHYLLRRHSLFVRWLQF